MERKRTSAARATCVAALALTALFLAASLDAQETRGRITGRVTDTTKAPIPGASVTLTDAARGTTASSTTGGEGLFLFNFLLPGTYQVTVEVAGFKKHIQDKVQVQISETRDLPIVLEVGGMEEAVNVTAEGAVLDTSGANMGFTVDARRIAELPLIHGDPYKIMGLATGLAHSGSQRLDRPYEPTHIVGFAFDGTRSNRSDLLIDGAPSTSTANQNEVIATYVPPSDLVQEFKVQTATFDAQFGNTEGGVTSISIKSGTNRLHGSVYYFAEPKSLAANDFFGNSRGQERPDTSSNRPGFTLSGPVRIPGLYDGRDQTFFTVGFEHIKDVRPRFDAGADSWVPTEALRNGDFSAYAGNITIYDPLTRVPSGSAVRRPAVPGQHHPGQPDQPGVEGDPRLLLPAQGPGSQRQHLRLDPAGDGGLQQLHRPPRPEDLQQQQDVRPVQLVQPRQHLQRVPGQPGLLGHLVPVPVLPGRRRRRARLQPDHRPERALRLQPLRAQLGPAGGRAELRPDDSWASPRSTTRSCPRSTGTSRASTSTGPP